MINRRTLARVILFIAGWLGILTAVLLLAGSLDIEGALAWIAGNVSMIALALRLGMED